MDGVAGGPAPPAAAGRSDRIPGPALPIAGDEIHVWFVPADVSGQVLDRLCRALAPEEIARARCYRFEADRRRSIVTRAALRHLLGRYRQIPPQELRIVAREHGKPALADGGIEFNATHAGDLVALAFAATAPVGIDVEQLRPMEDARAIARLCFSGDERAALAAAERRSDLFFAIWTAKEAVVKGLGKGLAAPLTGFTVPFRSPALASVACGAAPELAGWCAASVAPPVEGYRAAVAVRGSTWRIAVRTADPRSFIAD